MLRPTYNDLIQALHREGDGSQGIESRYSVVIASARRARQLIDGEEPLLPDEEGKKPLSIAIDEIFHKAVTIRQEIVVDEPPVIQKDFEKYSRYSVDDDDYDSDGEDTEEMDEEDGDPEDMEDEDEEDLEDSSDEEDFGSDNEA